MKIIKKSSAKYENIKALIRNRVPISKKSMRKITLPLRALHQRYFEDYIFIHINKCGGTSMERALGMPFINHRTAQEHRNALGKKIWSKRYKFALVRDPYDRIGSLFFYRHKNLTLHEAKQYFPYWLENVAEINEKKVAGPKLSPQTSWITDSNGNTIIDQWFKLEELDKELEELEFRLNKKLNVSVLNKKKNKINYMELYNNQTDSILKEAFSDDFDTFGYKYRDII
jgi:chondroitin 4-sulfotransferase 11